MSATLLKTQGSRASRPKNTSPKSDDLKFSGAYVDDDQAAALDALAAQKGYKNRAELIRAIYDAALAEVGKQ